MSAKTKTILLRFIRNFLSAGIASAVVFIESGTVISSQAEFKTFVYGLMIAFISGIVGATDKYLRYK